MKKSDIYSDSFRLEVLSAYFDTQESLYSLSSKTGVSRSTLWRWIHNFETSNPEMVACMKKKDSPQNDQSNEIAALKRENARLQQELKHEQLRSHAYDTMIDIAEEMFNIPIRKKSGTKQ